MHRVTSALRILRRGLAVALFPLVLAAGGPAGAAEIIGVAKPIGGGSAPDRAALHVQLLDVTDPDAPARIISELTFNPVSLIDIPFRLSYDPADISQDRAYAIYGRIIRDGATVFSSKSNAAVLTHGAPDQIDLIMSPVTKPTAATGPGLYGRIWNAGGGATMRFYEDDSVGGATACNTWRGSVKFDSSSMRFGHALQTMMACEEPKMQAEHEFLSKLPKIHSYRIEGAQLTLLDSAGATVMELTSEN